MTREERLENALMGLFNMVRNAPVSSGVCCCGDYMENHGHGISDHGPVDEWDHAVHSWQRLLSAEFPELRARLEGH